MALHFATLIFNVKMELVGNYISPSLNNLRFTCPHCGTVAQMVWGEAPQELSKAVSALGHSPGMKTRMIHTATCQCCFECSIWYESVMIYPDRENVPLPNPDLSENIRKIYEEAAAICGKSPRAAAALLRLAVQHLCTELDGKGDNINNDIKEFVKKGLPEKIQKALDIVRVTGNHAVHPGAIDFETSDTLDIVVGLFNIINLICEHCISEKKKIDAMYSQLPETDIKKIEKRDKI